MYRICKIKDHIYIYICVCVVYAHDAVKHTRIGYLWIPSQSQSSTDNAAKPRNCAASKVSLRKTSVVGKAESVAKTTETCRNPAWEEAQVCLFWGLPNQNYSNLNLTWWSKTLLRRQCLPIKTMRVEQLLVKAYANLSCWFPDLFSVETNDCQVQMSLPAMVSLWLNVVRDASFMHRGTRSIFRRNAMASMEGTSGTSHKILEVQTAPRGRDSSRDAQKHSKHSIVLSSSISFTETVFPLIVLFKTSFCVQLGEGQPLLITRVATSC